MLTHPWGGAGHEHREDIERRYLGISCEYRPFSASLDQRWSELMVQQSPLLGVVRRNNRLLSGLDDDVWDSDCGPFPEYSNAVGARR